MYKIQAKGKGRSRYQAKSPLNTKNKIKCDRDRMGAIKKR
jgi:hypothetical protein